MLEDLLDPFQFSRVEVLHVVEIKSLLLGFVVFLARANGTEADWLAPSGVLLVCYRLLDVGDCSGAIGSVFEGRQSLPLSRREISRLPKLWGLDFLLPHCSHLV